MSNTDCVGVVVSKKMIVLLTKSGTVIYSCTTIEMGCSFLLNGLFAALTPASCNWLGLSRVFWSFLPNHSGPSFTTRIYVNSCLGKFIPPIAQVRKFPIERGHIASTSSKRKRNKVAVQGTRVSMRVKFASGKMIGLSLG